ncbi:MAG: murein biosynthesis integral membrane protein MurJ [Planctomycetota bacterium]
MGLGRRVVSSAGLIAALTLLSRVLGLLREAMFSYFFSTSELLSAFRIAFQIPNLTRRMFGEGALSSAMVPVLTESLQARGEAESRRFVGVVLTAMLAVLGGLTVAAEAGLFCWRDATNDLVVDLTAILLPYGPLICAVAVAGGVLHVRGHFAVPAAAPSLLNLLMLSAMVGGGWYGGLSGRSLMYVVCAAALAAGLLQLAATLVALRFESLFPTLAWSWHDPQLRRVFSLMLPMALGLSAIQISTLMDSLIAYWFVIEDGQRVGPAVLGYAQFLYQLPLGVFGISIATASFPVLSARAAAGDYHGLAEVFERGVRLSLFIALPSSVGLAFIARPLVAALYQRGEFDVSDTARVSATLVYYSMGIAAYFVQHMVARTFYALHDSRTPARVAAATVALNLVLSLILVFPMEERGLALATSICAVVQVCWLIRVLMGRMAQIAWARLGEVVVRMALAAAVMLAALVLVSLRGVGPRIWGDMASVQVVVLVVVGAASFGVAGRLLGLEELREISRSGDREPSG